VFDDVTGDFDRQREREAHRITELKRTARPTGEKRPDVRRASSPSDSL
jgi:hypothetical protein